MTFTGEPNMAGGAGEGAGLLVRKSKWGRLGPLPPHFWQVGTGPLPILPDCRQRSRLILDRPNLPVPDHLQHCQY
jgi:hypothetical protein